MAVSYTHLLGTKFGLALSNGVGVIDSDYRGEIHVGLANHGDQPYTCLLYTSRCV